MVRKPKKWLNDRYLGAKAKRLKQTHAEMRPVERPLMSRYSCQDSMLALWGATPSALSTSATRSRSATETTSWGPKRDLKILPYILLCSIWKTAETLFKHKVKLIKKKTVHVQGKTFTPSKPKIKVLLMLLLWKYIFALQIYFCWTTITDPVVKLHFTFTLGILQNQ